MMPAESRFFAAARLRLFVVFGPWVRARLCRCQLYRPLFSSVMQWS